MKTVQGDPSRASEQLRTAADSAESAPEHQVRPSSMDELWMAPIESTSLAHLGERLPGCFWIPADGGLELDTVIPRPVLLERRFPSTSPFG